MLAESALKSSIALRDLSAAAFTYHARQVASRPPDDISRLESAVATFCEAVRRTMGFTPHTEQLVAALVLSRGQIVEMATGEGKTIASAGVASLVALEGRRVHLMTQNNYLALRDYETLRPIYELLGLTAGVLQEGDSTALRRRTYRGHIVHGSGPEFGFDYLRQQNSRRRNKELRLGARSVQLLNSSAAESLEIAIPYDFAVVDEVDSVLIDEATLPLVLSEPVAGGDDARAVVRACEVAAQLQANIDYMHIPAERRVALTNVGEERLQRELTPAKDGVLQHPWKVYVQKALQARLVLQRNVDYVVNAGKIGIVDQHTGRVFTDRTWQEGLHQAVEAKEGVTVTPQSLPVARILRQKFMGLYAGVCGLSGTMTGVEREFESRLKLRTVTIPRHKAGRRTDLPDRFFVDLEAKYRAAVAEIQAVHLAGRPILVGTRTIESTHELSRRLTAAGIAHQVLNGVQDAHEAEIVSQAGRAGAVTIATNLAGRGTDIRVAPETDPLGGMHVLGFERHEARRVDLQLAGRTARQGAAGSSQFFVAADDALISRHGGSTPRKMLAARHVDGEIHEPFFREVAAAQRRAEAEAERAREDLLAQS
jgi:preprotein translocase subunit SecA